MAEEHASYRLVESVRRFDIDELDEITVSRPVLIEGRNPIPAGSTGTVVAVWGAGEAYEVEFDEPFHALATVSRDAIAEHRRAA